MSGQMHLKVGKTDISPNEDHFLNKETTCHNSRNKS